MKSYRQVKRIVIAAVGGTVLLFGLALLVLPGPAFLVIPAGLAILASEFEWARRWLKKAKEMVKRPKQKKTADTEFERPVSGKGY